MAIAQSIFDISRSSFLLTPPFLYRVFKKKRFDRLRLNISATKYQIFRKNFPLKTEIHTHIFNNKHFCAILGGPDIYKTKCGSETDQFILILSHSGLKTAKFWPSSANWPKTGPDSFQVAPSGPSNSN